jgi:hypothetical protein
MEDPLDDQTPLVEGGKTKQWSKKKIIVLAVLCGFLFLLLLAVGIAIAVLYPSSPSITVAGVIVDVAGAVTVRLSPPMFSVPLSLFLNISNPNPYAFGVLSSSLLQGFYNSSTLSAPVLLGHSSPSFSVPSHSTVSRTLPLTLEYQLFDSPVVLGDIVAGCTLNGEFLVDLQLQLHITALFLKNLTISRTTEVRVNCKVV